MKIKTTPTLWVIFFVLSLFIFNKIALQYIEPREIIISQQQANEIGIKIWQNEGAGKFENLIVWHEGERFPSLGIGHFIWYPSGTEQTFEESFPDLIDHISLTREIPSWLKEQKTPPWKTRTEFQNSIDSDFTRRLRRFLNNTKIEQTQFIVQRLEKALPKMLRTIKSGFIRESIRTNFYHVSMQKNGVYALVDYVNFKGEGISQAERYNNRGWGLLQVLRHMDHTETDIMKAFIKSADQRLTRRAANAPTDESKWLPLWRKRIQTYSSSL